MSKQKITIVSFEEFREYEFIAPATFYILNAMGEYVFIHTSKREVAQEWIDREVGKGRYSVVASKLQKSKPKAGGLSCRGTATRR